MAKFYGMVGFVVTHETSPGIWTEEITERPYKGDVIRAQERTQPSDNLNDNLTIDNRLSIVSDSHMATNLEHMRYVTWGGTKWKIKSIEINRPRIILNVGGVYSG